MGQKIRELYKELMQVLADGQRAAVETVCSPDGTVSKRVIVDSGYVETTVQTSIATSNPNGPVSHSFSEDGTLTVVERYLPRPRLIILGGGHIALAFTQMAKACDFNIVIYDDRPMFANKERFPEADEVICDDFSKLFERIKVRATDYVVILTRGHKHDRECIEGILKGVQPTYAGMIGSRRRIAIIMKQLADEGYPRERLDSIYTPIGIRIGAITPAEIAVSILAEVIQVKRLGTAAEGRAAKNMGGTAAIYSSNVSCDLETVAKLAGDKWDDGERASETTGVVATTGVEADALITILATTGSVPRETGAKMSMTYDGFITGTIGGGCAEGSVMQDARTVIREGGWRVVTVDMTDTAEEDGMVCGGTMTALIEKAL